MNFGAFAAGLAVGFAFLLFRAGGLGIARALQTMIANGNGAAGAGGAAGAAGAGGAGGACCDSCASFAPLPANAPVGTAPYTPPPAPRAPFQWFSVVR